MIARIRKSKDQGFTLIELLVVMIIIGILAAIAIPVFLSQRQKAQDSAAKSDVSVLGKEIATYFVDGTSLPTVTQADVGEEIVVNGNSLGQASDGSLLGTDGTDTIWATAGLESTTWCVFITNAAGDDAVQGFSYSADQGLQTVEDRPCI